MIASLGMYDFGPAQPANDRYWALIRDGLRARGFAAPEALTRGETAYFPAWEASELVLSQTCGYPFRALLHGRVAYVGTPDYGVDGCAPGYYCSVLVVRADDPRSGLYAFDGAVFAYNEALSQSGWAAPQVHFQRRGLRLTASSPTGGHRLSARAVAEGQADIAALDAVTWELMQGTDDVTTRLRVIARTEPTPGLPYIAALGSDAAATFDAIAGAIAALQSQDRQALRLKGLVRIPETDYLAVANPALSPADTTPA